jgi:zinc transporter ZupT
MSFAVFVQSSIAVGFTSAVPLLIFFILGPMLCSNGHQSVLLASLVSLAVGSLLGDVFFHLIPEIFGLRGDYLRNCALMLFGVFIFFVGERVLQHYHTGHGHSHITQFTMLSDPEINGGMEAEVELEVLSSEGRSERETSPESKRTTAIGESTPAALRTAKPVGLLVLTSDFIHNFVDGIAIGVSFATSFPVGMSTAVAVFLHEIPHELGDFAILLSAGYTPMTIVICNILTTLSSFLGVAVSLVLIAINSDPGQAVEPFALALKPAILSLTAGNFLYIALADLIPELLNTGTDEERTSPSQRRWIPIIQYISFLIGATAMMLIKIFSD